MTAYAFCSRMGVAESIGESGQFWGAVYICFTEGGFRAVFRYVAKNLIVG